MPSRRFDQVVTDAVNDIAEHGYTSQERVDFWLGEIAKAAKESSVPNAALSEALDRTLRAIYQKLVERGGLVKRHPGVSRFTVERLRPQLQAELRRRVAASANLITLNREQSIAKTMQRFSGWATSVPKGGSAATSKAKVKVDVKKALRQLPFEERRVLIDQGHKFTAALNSIIATDNGAVAVIWHSHFRQPGYNYREDHKERDGQVYTLRDNWAQQRGLMKVGPAGYYDQITAFAEEPFCRCYGTYLADLRDLPNDMLTVKGRAELQRVRVA
jgi:hypothetical protein